MKRKSSVRHAFTLIELLVVIAIIGLLLAIIIPSLKKATEITRKVMCKSNLRQLSIAMNTYENECKYNFRNFKTWNKRTTEERNKSWFWVGGTADLGHEEEPRAIGFLMKAGLLPNREIFFCPGVSNVSWKKNYSLIEATQGIVRVIETEEIYRQVATGGLQASDRPVFWGTYAWIWKKELRDNNTQVVSVNNISNGAMMVDMTNGLWRYAGATNNGQLGVFMNRVNIYRSYPHGNVLMQDFSVANPSDRDDKLNEWLWGRPYWAGDPANEKYNDR
jgi:prepilin-type N-terminal cleavage/methylation domain-containing protein